MFTQAINHPVGHVTEAVIRWWLNTKPKRDEGLPKRFAKFLQTILDSADADMVYGKSIIARHALNLYFADAEWTRKHLLLVFVWQQDTTNAQAAWQGFMYSPHWLLDLVFDMKDQLIETARYLEHLGECRRQYVSFIVTVAMPAPEVLGKSELDTLMKYLEPEDRLKVLRRLLGLIDAVDRPKVPYWKKRVAPFLKRHFTDEFDQDMADIAARIVAISEDALPVAYGTLKYFLKPVSYPAIILSDLSKSQDYVDHPELTLEFWDKIMSTERVSKSWSSIGKDNLRRVLEQVEQADASLRKHAIFERLLKLSR